MEKEFAVDEDGDIKTNLGYFVSGMEKEMPADRIIQLNENGGWKSSSSRMPPFVYWVIKNDMIAELF